MVNIDGEELSAAEEAELEELLKSYGSPSVEEKPSVHTFLTAISRAKDTIKTGNLDATEVGIPALPVRSLKTFELYSRDLCDDKIMADIFKGEAEILTSTSLSKNAKLINLSVLNRKEITDPSNKPRVENKSWFKKKEPQQREDF